MNPIVINTVNVIQFGFSSTFVLETSNLVFDITGITIFNPGGENNIPGICFQVIDPSGSYLSQIDWSNPAISGSATTYTVPLSGYPSMFGWYKILGVLREQDGTDYAINLSVNVCKPVGFVKGFVPGNMVEDVDCTAPKVGVTDQTNYTYLNKAPYTLVKNGMLYYPQGTLDPVPFSYTPFAVYGSGNVYTGDYTVRAKTIALYDQGQFIYVQVSYTVAQQFNVNCNSNLCTLMCCMQDLQSVVSTQCNTPAAVNAQKKLDQATIPFLMAITQEKCGQNSGDLVNEIMNILGCDCNCDGDLVEPKPIYTAFSPTVLQGECGTTATYDNLQGIWVIRSQTITVTTNNSPSTSALTITSSTTGCNTAWNIDINYALLTQNVLYTIRDTPTYLALFNSLVQTSTLDLSALGDNCVIDTTNCDYSLTVDATNPAVLIISVLIDGITNPAPTGLSAADAPNIAIWLNSLDKGVWIATYDSGTKKTTITTAANPAIIGTAIFSLNGVQLVMQFNRSCGSIVAVLKAIIDYLCALTDGQVKIGRTYSVCTLLANGTVQTTQYAANGTISIGDVITAISTSFCASIQNLINAGTITCAKIKSVFADKTSPINTTLDVIYATRGTTTTVPGNCGTLSWEDFARSLFTFMVNTNQADIITLFCQVKDRCFVPVCNPVTASTMELIEPCPGIAGISGAFTT